MAGVGFRGSGVGQQVANFGQILTSDGVDEGVVGLCAFGGCVDGPLVRRPALRFAPQAAIVAKPPDTFGTVVRVAGITGRLSAAIVG